MGNCRTDPGQYGSPSGWKKWPMKKKPVPLALKVGILSALIPGPLWQTPALSNLVTWWQGRCSDSLLNLLRVYKEEKIQLPVTTTFAFSVLKKWGMGPILVSRLKWSNTWQWTWELWRWPSDGWIHGIHLCQRCFRTISLRIPSAFGSLGKSPRNPFISWISILSMDQMPLQPWVQEQKSNTLFSGAVDESSHSYERDPLGFCSRNRAHGWCLPQERLSRLKITTMCT